MYNSALMCAQGSATPCGGVGTAGLLLSNIKLIASRHLAKHCVAFIRVSLHLQAPNVTTSTGVLTGMLMPSASCGRRLWQPR